MKRKLWDIYLPVFLKWKVTGYNGFCWYERNNQACLSREIIAVWQVYTERGIAACLAIWYEMHFTAFEKYILPWAKRMFAYFHASFSFKRLEDQDFILLEKRSMYLYNNLYNMFAANVQPFVDNALFVLYNSVNKVIVEIF